MKDFLDKLTNSVDIVDVVKEKVSLAKKGREYIGLCPFHQERTPSFYVNPSKGFYYCFGCQAKGNVVTFYMSLYNMTFKETIEILAKRAGLTLPAKISFNEVFKEDSKRNALEKICDIAKNHYITNLYGSYGKKALDYLLARGLSKSVIQTFELGFALSRSTTLWRILENEKIPQEDILEIGLKNHSNTGETYDFFRDRIIFPIKNSSGKVIAFGGRAMQNEQIKYLNTKESYIFHKKSNLYALNIALKNLKNNNLVIVEGYMDVIALHSNNIDTAIATLGTAITQDHLDIISKYDDSPIFCLDGDLAGQKATDRVMDLYLEIMKAGMNPRFVMLENKEDPDSFILKHGRGNFMKLLENAKSLSEMLFVFESAEHNLRVPEISMMVLSKLEKRIMPLKDNRLRNSYKSYFKDMIYQYGKNSKNILSNRSTVRSFHVKFDSKDNIIGGIILACVLLYPRILYDVEEELGNCSFVDVRLEKVRETCIKNIHILDTAETNFFKDLEDECNYILNMKMVTPKINQITSLDEARKRFNESYNLILIENLERRKKEIVLEQKELGKHRDTYNENSTDRKLLESKIKILMGERVEIDNYIINLRKLGNKDFGEINA